MSVARLLNALVASAAMALLTAGAMAQAPAWPTKPVKLIVNFAPGGSTDNALRPFAERLSKTLGQQFVIENRGGASGAIGIEAAVKAPPDGYTFVATPALTVAILPNLRKTPWDPFKDLMPVSYFTDGTLLFAVHPSVPATSVQEVVAYAKKNPGKLSWGTAGMGSMGHMTYEVFKHAAGLDILHVPYRGGGESLAGFLSNEVQLHADPNTMPHVAAGKAKLYAVIDRQRHPDYPNVPNMKEVYPEIDFVAWFGLFAPVGTPQPIVQKMSDEMAKIAKDPELKANFLKLALAPYPGSPEYLAQALRKDYDRFGKLIKELNLKMD
jgi:tripartite-type tricarboxylate transporter receptor subunit TctC